jgi:hypothetical protein
MAAAILFGIYPLLFLGGGTAGGCGRARLALGLIATSRPK